MSNATQSTDRFLDWYDRAGSRPFFAFINYYDAHFSYNPPAPYRARFASSPSPRDLYDGEVAYIDDELRRLFSELRKRGTLNETYVIITSDHGELFGEHGLTTHGNSVYAPVLHVPLIISGPGIGATTIDHAVSLRDLAATMVSVAGIQYLFPGVPLTGYMTDSTFRSSPVFSSYGAGGEAWHSFLDDELHLIRKGTAEMLYRYRSDAAEMENLVDVPSMEPQLQKLRAILDQATAEFADSARPR